jgi:hypothetical protein
MLLRLLGRRKICDDLNNSDATLAQVCTLMLLNKLQRQWREYVGLPFFGTWSVCVSVCVCMCFCVCVYNYVSVCPCLACVAGRPAPTAPPAGVIE